MPTRRSFLTGLTGLTASGLLPRATWAAAGAPDFLSAARTADGAYRLVGLRLTGEPVFSLPLPDRGHAAAVHPHRPLAVAFARRPGDFALVLDCFSGEVAATLHSPPGRHFYGHGAFSPDGATLYTPENDYEAGQGVIGMWDTTRNFARLGEFSSRGVGPHDIALMPGGDSLVIANGGIETHPDTGRATLNLATMRPNLAYVSLSGTPLETVELAPDLHKNSIRHLALRPDGLVAFAMQWQGDTGTHPPLLGLHRRGDAPRLLAAEPGEQSRLKGYAGSVAISPDGNRVAISSPRGGLAHVYDPDSGTLVSAMPAPDICGLGPCDGGFFYTTGSGETGRLSRAESLPVSHPNLNWDNHLVALPRRA